MLIRYCNGSFDRSLMGSSVIKASAPLRKPIPSHMASEASAKLQESIISSLTWLGIEPDEDPVFQSKNIELRLWKILKMLYKFNNCHF